MSGKQKKKQQNGTIILFWSLVVAFFVSSVVFSIATFPENNDVQASASTLVVDDFTSYHLGDWVVGSTMGTWIVENSGGGNVGVENAANKVLFLKPKASISPTESGTALIKSILGLSTVDVSSRVKVVQQLRSSSTPVGTARIIWHYIDDAHYYYFALKTDGWELGKMEGNNVSGARILSSGSTPQFVPGSWYGIHVTQQQDTMKVYLNDQVITVFTDTQRPYLTGKIALYAKDVYAQFDTVVIKK